MNESQQRLDAQFRREARVGSLVIGLALLGFFAAAYFRLSGGFEQNYWAGEIPPVTQPLAETAAAESQLAARPTMPRTSSAPAARRQTTPLVAPEPPTPIRPAPTAVSQRSPASRELAPAAEHGALADDELAQSGPSPAARDNLPSPAVPAYDILSRLRASESQTPPLTPSAATTPPANVLGKELPKPMQLPKLSAPESVAFESPRTHPQLPPPLPSVQTSRGSDPTAVPHLRLPSALPTTASISTIQPPAPPRRTRSQPDSTATLPSGSRQRHVATTVDPAVAPAGYAAAPATASQRPRPTRIATVTPVPEEPAASRPIPEAGRGELFPAEASLREQEMYLTAAGDTLFAIAADRMGQASRYLELLELNRGILPPTVGSSTPLPSGLPLRLPPR